MISNQPVLSLKYFQFRKNKLPKRIKKLFYLSWEDALWDILSKKEVKKGSIVLIPNFYCEDVEKNIKRHGYKTAYYKILPNLEADRKSFISSINKRKPKIVVVFHPVGIRSNLFYNQRWLAKITNNSILIEDSVHKVLSPKDVKIIKKNHYIIDSLRKVVPVQGSNVYGNVEDLNFNAPFFTQSIIYRIRVDIYWLLMVLCWTFGFGKAAEKFMQEGYDLIGDSKLSSRGGVLGKILGSRINIEKIQEIKVKQVNYYERKFKTLPNKIKIKKSNKRYLRGYPVVLPVKKSDKILNYLRLNKLLLRFELDGCPWSKKQKIIYLPLGFQINERKLKKVCNLVLKAFEI